MKTSLETRNEQLWDDLKGMMVGQTSIKIHARNNFNELRELCYKGNIKEIIEWLDSNQASVIKLFNLSQKSYDEFMQTFKTFLEAVQQKESKVAIVMLTEEPMFKNNPAFLHTFNLVVFCIAVKQVKAAVFCIDSNQFLLLSHNVQNALNKLSENYKNNDFSDAEMQEIMCCMYNKCHTIFPIIDEVPENLKSFHANAKNQYFTSLNVKKLLCWLKVPEESFELLISPISNTILKNYATFFDKICLPGIQLNFKAGFTKECSAENQEKYANNVISYFESFIEKLKGHENNNIIGI